MPSPIRGLVPPFRLMLQEQKQRDEKDRGSGMGTGANPLAAIDVTSPYCSVTPES